MCVILHLELPCGSGGAQACAVEINLELKLGNNIPPYYSDLNMRYNLKR